MRYVAFGPDRRKVSTVMLGLMRVDDVDAKRLSSFLHTALDLGINALDTADIYAGGKSERLLGEVFSAEPGLRDKLFLQTKVGIHRTEKLTHFDFSHDYIVSATKASLERLGLPYVDSLLLHRPDILMEPSEVAGAFQELHAQGLVRDFGVSNQNPATMRRLQSALPLPLCANQVQLSIAFAPAYEAVVNANMENQAACMRDGGIFEYAALNDQVIQTWSTFQYGYFEGTFLNNPRYQQLNDTLDELAPKYGVSKAALCVAWNLRYPAKVQAIVGTMNPQHLADLAAGADVDLSREDWYRLYLAAGRQLP